MEKIFNYSEILEEKGQEYIPEESPFTCCALVVKADCTRVLGPFIPALSQLPQLAISLLL